MSLREDTLNRLMNQQGSPEEQTYQAMKRRIERLETKNERLRKELRYFTDDEWHTACGTVEGGCAADCRRCYLESLLEESK